MKVTRSVPAPTAQVIGAVGIAAVVGGFGLWGVRSPVAGGALPVAVFCLLVSVPIFRAVTAGDPAPGVFAMLFGGLVVKLICSFVRMWMFAYLYGGNGDAGLYDAGARELLSLWGSGDNRLMAPLLSTRPAETWRIATATAAIYRVVGANWLAGFFVFGWFSFLGQVCAFKAGRMRFPDVNPSILGALVLFTPTLLYWPASIGKDAGMELGIGVALLGLACLLEGRLVGGLVAVGFSMVPILLIRTHIYYPLVGGGAAAFMGWALNPQPHEVVKHWRERERRKAAREASRVLAVVLGLCAALVVFARLDVLYSPSAGEEEAGTAADQLVVMSGEGGSAFTPVKIRTPLDFPYGTLSVLGRPFPWEAKSPVMVMSSFESVLVVLACLYSLVRRRAWRHRLRNPFFVALLVTSLGYVLGFSNFANSGILARQRAQLLLPLTVALAVTLNDARRRRRAEAQ